MQQLVQSISAGYSSGIASGIKKPEGISDQRSEQRPGLVKNCINGAKALLLSAGIFFAASQDANSQVTYAISGPVPGNLLRTSTDANTTGATQILTYNAGSTSTNQWSASQAIPFSFNYFGTPVTNYVVNKNGLLTFDASLAGATTTASLNTNTALPEANLPNNTIAWFWGDFASPIPSGDNVWSITYGTAPNRQHWVYTYSFKMDALSFSYNAVVLEETTNKVYIVDMYNSSTPGTFTVGLQQNATTAVQLAGSPNLTPQNTGSGNTDNTYYMFEPFIPSPLDVKATALVSPGSTGCFGPNQTVSVTIFNNGTAALDFTTNPVTVSVTATGANAGTIAPVVVNTGTLAIGASQNVVVTTAFNMSTAGTTTFNATATVSGDGNPQNDAMVPADVTLTADQVPVTATLPQAVDFTGFTGSNLSTVFPGWREADGVPADGTASSWLSDDFANVSGGPNDKAARLNLDAASDDEWIIGPKVTATATTALKFDLALTEDNATTPATLGSDDELRIMVSTNCGVTFTTLRTYSATTPISNTGQSETVSLAAYAGQDIIVAFFATEGTVNDPEDNDLFIDNIFLGTPPSLDFGATVLAAPGATGCYTAAQPVTVTIQNYGPNTLNFATNPVTVTVNVTGAATQMLDTILTTGTLAAGATMDVTIGNLNMTATGTYTFDGGTTLTGDGNPTNNNFATATRTVTPVATLPQNVDFTGFTGSNLNTLFPDWTEATGPTPTGTTSIWANSTTAQETHFGTTTARINLFTNTREEWILGPKIVPTANTQLRFKAAITNYFNEQPDPDGMQGTDDKVQVMVSTNCGATFTPIYTFDASNTATLTNVLSIFTLPLAAYAGQEIVVGFYATDGPSNDLPDYDFHLDDIFIGTLPTLDMAATALVSPVAGNCFGTTEPVSVTIQNFGTAPIDFTTNPTTVTVNVTGAATQTLTTTVNTGTLAPNASQNVIAGNLNMSAAGTYTFVASTSVTGDGNTANDTLAAISILNGTIATFPHLEDFSTFPASGAAADNNGWTGTTTGLRWESQDGPTTSSNTGPATDHTTGATGGKYVYLETTSGSAGDQAELVTPCINLTGQTNMAMEFWYHMYGATIDTLHIDVFNGTTWVDNVWMLGGQQQNATTDPWIADTVNLNAYNGNIIKVRFRASRGTSFTGDIAVDDVRFFQMQTAPAVPTVTASGPATFCTGGSVVLTASSTTPGVTYQWFNGGTAISGATSATYTATATGTYTVTAIAGTVSSAPSAVKAITVNATPATPTITLPAGASTSICQGSSLVLTGASTTAGVTYRWSLNGAPIAGATSATYTATTAGNYRVIATNSGCSDSSAVTAVTVNPVPATPTITQTGNTLTASATTGTYQWFEVNGTTLTPVTGATSATFTPTANGSYTVKVTVNGCESDAAVATPVVLGMAALAPGMDVSVYPNPTAGKFAVQLTGFEKEATIQVINVTGQVISETKVAITSDKTSKVFNLNGMAKGVYILKVTSGDNLTFRKVILD